MLPDYDTLVAGGYDYLPVGGPLLRGRIDEAPAPLGNGREAAVSRVPG
jgi:hypothetical protein